MGINRRDFLKTIGVATASVATPAALKAKPKPGTEEFYSILFDANLCIGCRKCEWACNDQNDLPNQPFASFDDKSVFEQEESFWM